jgi:hypothetical protein
LVYVKFFSNLYNSLVLRPSFKFLLNIFVLKHTQNIFFNQILTPYFFLNSYAHFYLFHNHDIKNKIIYKRKIQFSGLILFLWGLDSKDYFSTKKTKFVDLLYSYYLSGFIYAFNYYK